MTPATATLFLSALLAAPLAAQGTEAPASRPVLTEEEKRLEGKAKELLDTAEDVQAEVEKLCGQRFEHPVKKGVHGEAELREFIVAKLREEYGDGKLERSQYMLRTMGFIPPDMDLEKAFLEVLLSQIGGFYDPERKQFFMMLRSAAMGEFANRTVIAHELTHALDDQLYGLGDRMKPGLSEDAGFAVGAVAEGSATCLMMRWGVANQGKYDMKEMLESQKEEMERNLVFMQAPPYFHTMLARYMMGMYFLTKGKGPTALVQARNGVRDAVGAAFGEMPRSSEQILHPDKYWDPQRRDLPVVLADEEAFARIVAGRCDLPVADEDTLGELLCSVLGKKHRKKYDENLMAALSALMMQPRYWVHASGRGLGGDRVFIMARTRKAPEALLWVTFWDTAGDAQEFADCYAKQAGKGLGYGQAVGPPGRGVRLREVGGQGR
ncbi:MAG: hypothetical protein R3F30_00780 [Planctomycetota bacterium]